MRRTTIALTMPLVGLTLALGACTGSSDGAAKPTADGRPTAEDTEDTEDTENPKATKPPEDIEPVEGPAGANAACLLGTWRVDPESVKDVGVAAAGLTSGGVEMTVTATVTGDAYMTFSADGLVTTEYVDQTTDMTATAEDVTVRSYGSTDGAMTGSYTATETEVTTFDLDASGVVMEIATTINGEPFDAGDMAGMTRASWEAGSTAEYVCSGDTLEMTPVVTLGADPSGFTTRYFRE